MTNQNESRRQLLTALGTGVTVLLGGCVSGPNDTNTPDETPAPVENVSVDLSEYGPFDGWSMSGGDPRRQHRLDEGPDTAPSQQWEMEFSTSEIHLSSAGDVLFVTAKRKRLVPVDVSEGRELVETLSPNHPPESPATIVDDHLYYGTTTGRLIARNADSGDVSWYNELPKVPDDLGGETSVPLASSPAVVDSRTYVSGVDPADWKEAAQFCFRTAEENGGDSCDSWPVSQVAKSMADPIVADELLVTQTQDIVEAFDRTDGSRRWSRELSSPDSYSAVSPTPAIGPTLVYIQTHEGLLAVNREDGSVAWTRTVDPILGSLSDRLYSVYPPTVGDGVVYSGFIDGTFAALDAETGEELWRFRPEHDVVLWTAPALDTNRVYVGAEEPQGTVDHPEGVAWDRSRVFALDRETGEPTLLAERDGHLSDPVVGSGQVYVAIGANVTCFG